MVLNRPWPGQLIHRIYLLYFKSLSSSCPESRGVFDGDCPLGWVCRACQQSCEQPDQLEQKGRKPPAPLLEGSRPLWALGGGQSEPTSSCSHCPAWHQRAGMALVQAACLSRPRILG